MQRDRFGSAKRRHVASIMTYPVKAVASVELTRAEVLPAGLKGDRRWLVTDADGTFLTQRNVPQLAKLNAKILPEGLKINYEGANELTVSIPISAHDCKTVQIWKDKVPALVADEKASRWLSNILEREVQLVFMLDETSRPVDPNFGQVGEHVSFADGFPVMLTTTASLRDLEVRAGQRFDMRRFRPNLVIENDTPWEEDTWKEIEIGAVRFRVSKPCRRCVVTTLDPSTGKTLAGNEPLATLGKFHRDNTGGIIFGQNLVPLSVGDIEVGDQVKITHSGTSNLD